TNSVVHGSRMGFSHASSDSAAVLADPTIDTVVIATRHDSHAALTAAALKAGKHVFVEKPLAMDHSGLAEIEAAYAKANRQLMVGFNRRFAPQIQTMKSLLDASAEPKSFIMVMNAGAIPADHWTQDPAIGGGRIIGEACHYIDLMRYLAGAKISSVQARRMGDAPSVAVTDDKVSITLGFADGSFGSLHYLANGGASFAKERIEVFSAGGTLQLDNFLKLRGYNWRGFRKSSLRRQDKGQLACAKAFLNAVRAGSMAPEAAAIPASELFEVARVTLDVAEALRSGSDYSSGMP
ncbi:MAG: Gfo/Idh/MocA family oxidoreductase, partial [Planktotalea sp.]|uniref:Gfo/Idh/MocA family protein n=1 Tax=Planktotalea sp. TaxID=2029877 RepID=UPI003C73CF03